MSLKNLLHNLCLFFLLVGCANVFRFEKKLEVRLEYDVEKADNFRILKVRDARRNRSGVLAVVPGVYAFYYCHIKKLDGFPIMSREEFYPDPKNPGHMIVEYKFSCSAEEKELKEHIFSKVYDSCHLRSKIHPDIQEICDHIDLKYGIFARN